MVETDAAETIGTSETIFAELTFATIAAVLRVIDHVATGTINALCAPLASDTECQPRAGNALPRIPGVVDILRVKDAEAPVAVF